MLSTVVLDDEHNWDFISPHWWWHTAPVTTGATPFSLVYGWEAKLPEDVLFSISSVEVTNSHGYAEVLKERIQHAYQRVRDHSMVEQKKQKANYDRFTQENTFQNGSLVWLHCPAVPRGKSPKFHHPWQGCRVNWANGTYLDNQTITHLCSESTTAGYDIPRWRKVILRTTNGCLKRCLHSKNTASFKGRAAHGGGVRSELLHYTQIEKEIFDLQKTKNHLFTQNIHTSKYLFIHNPCTYY